MSGLWKSLTQLFICLPSRLAFGYKLLFMSGVGGAATPTCQTRWPPAAVILLSCRTWKFSTMSRQSQSHRFPFDLLFPFPFLCFILFIFWLNALKMLRPWLPVLKRRGAELEQMVAYAAVFGSHIAAATASQRTASLGQQMQQQHNMNNRNGHLSTADVLVVSSWCMWWLLLLLLLMLWLLKCGVSCWS